MNLVIQFGHCLNFGRHVDYSLLIDEIAVDRLYPQLRIYRRGEWRKLWTTRSSASVTHAA